MECRYLPEFPLRTHHERREEGSALSLRQKLLLLFSLTVAAAVAAVAWTVLVRVRKVFDERDREETALVVSQFQREFQHRSADVAAAVDRIAASERMRTLSFELTQSGDPSHPVQRTSSRCVPGEFI